MFYLALRSGKNTAISQRSISDLSSESQNTNAVMWNRVGFKILTCCALLLGLQSPLLATPIKSNSQYSDPILPNLSEIRQGSFLFRSMTPSEESLNLDIDLATLISTDVEMDISGIVARVVVTQSFKNPGDEWIEGLYIFPLPEDSAVDQLYMEIGDRIIEGNIEPKTKAKEIYSRAKKAGHRASLVEQQRPNIFTTSVANISPHEEIKIRISYLQTLTYSDNRYRIRFPMVVAPRYHPIPVDHSSSPSEETEAGGLNQESQKIELSIIPPDAPFINPVSLTVRLNPGFPLQSIESTYHYVTKKEGPDNRVTLSLAGTVPADRDFELTWQPRLTAKPQATLLTESFSHHTYGLLMVLPPKATAERARIAREVIFVIDRSGSMYGSSISEARSALISGIKRLHPEDFFNIIDFNNTTGKLFFIPSEATLSNKKRAIHYVSHLSADGGTEMAPALDLALRDSSTDGRLRQVIFVTDGAIGNESELFSLIKSRLGDSRLFTVGIGSAPNSFFMSRAASLGRGTHTTIGKPEEVHQKMMALYHQLENPVFANLSIRSEDQPLSVFSDYYPNPLHDLYQNQPLIIAMRLNTPIDELEITGTLAGAPWHLRAVSQSPDSGAQLSSLWARKKIAQLVINQNSNNRSQTRALITGLGLDHHLVTPYTSLVAVDKTPARTANNPLKRIQMPTHLPDGWRLKSSSNSTPRPSLHTLLLAKTATPATEYFILAIVLFLLALLVWHYGRQRLA